MRSALLLVAVLAVASCYIGPSVKQFPATVPDGALVQLALKRRPGVIGELLQVQDSALLVRVDRSVTLVPLRLVERGQAPGVIWAGGSLNRRTRERLRLISRFPYGLPAEQLRTLLAAYGRDSLEVVR